MQYKMQNIWISLAVLILIIAVGSNLLGSFGTIFEGLDELSPPPSSELVDPNSSSSEIMSLNTPSSEIMSLNTPSSEIMSLKAPSGVPASGMQSEGEIQPMMMMAEQQEETPAEELMPPAQRSQEPEGNDTTKKLSYGPINITVSYNSGARGYRGKRPSLENRNFQSGYECPKCGKAPCQCNKKCPCGPNCKQCGGRCMCQSETRPNYSFDSLTNQSSSPFYGRTWQDQNV